MPQLRGNEPILGLKKIFDKWEVDFVGPINPPSIILGAIYIITTIEYLTRWVETSIVKDYREETAMRFLFEKVVTRLGFPRILMSDQGIHFINSKIQEILE
jgi:hypothetical protein